MDEIILGGGCFWCIEGGMKGLRGILEVKSGYSGGDVPNPSYEQICGKKTGHAEVVKIDFDSKIISYEEILNFFFEIHDPTTLNSQGPDIGTQYRSEIFYIGENQKKIAEKIIEENNKKLSGKVVTKLSMLKNYCIAEDYHQKYLLK